MRRLRIQVFFICSGIRESDGLCCFFCRIYNVLVGKISTRKHKQWESDGILEVSGKSAVLKVWIRR